jgi:hypothetical protein
VDTGSSALRPDLFTDKGQDDWSQDQAASQVAQAG